MIWRSQRVVTNQNQQVNTLRGLALVLVVLTHVMLLHRLFSLEAGDLKEPDGNKLDQLWEILVPVRIPLFILLSGWVYAYRPLEKGKVRAFARGKARRILIPLLVVSILEFFYLHFRNRVASAPQMEWTSNFLEFLWVPLSHLWFLYAILWVFLVVAAIEWTGFLRRFRNWALVTTLAFAGFFIGPNHYAQISFFGEAIPNYLAIFSALLLSGFFLLGIGLNRFQAELRTPRFYGLAVLFLFGSIIAEWALPQGQKEWVREVITLTRSVGGLFLLTGLRWHWGPLAYIGRHSLTCYLYHGYAIYLAFLLLPFSGSGADWWLFLPFGLVVGIGLPIVFELLLPRGRARTLFFGLRP